MISAISSKPKTTGATGYLLLSPAGDPSSAGASLSGDVAGRPPRPSCSGLKLTYELLDSEYRGRRCREACRLYWLGHGLQMPGCLASNADRDTLLPHGLTNEAHEGRYRQVYDGAP